MDINTVNAPAAKNTDNKTAYMIAGTAVAAAAVVTLGFVLSPIVTPKLTGLFNKLTGYMSKKGVLDN